MILIMYQSFDLERQHSAGNTGEEGVLLSSHTRPVLRERPIVPEICWAPTDAHTVSHTGSTTSHAMIEFF